MEYEFENRKILKRRRKRNLYGRGGGFRRATLPGAHTPPTSELSRGCETR